MFIVGTQYSQSGISYGRLSPPAPFLAGSLALSLTSSQCFCWFSQSFPVALHLAFSFAFWLLLLFLAAAEKPRHNWQSVVASASSSSWWGDYFFPLPQLRPAPSAILGKKSCFKNCLRPHCWRCSFSPRKNSNSLPSPLFPRFPWLIVLFIFSAHLPSPSRFCRFCCRRRWNLWFFIKTLYFSFPCFPPSPHPVKHFFIYQLNQIFCFYQISVTFRWFIGPHNLWFDVVPKDLNEVAGGENK